MTPMLEKKIEKIVCDYAKRLGILVYKFSSPGHAAVPDRLFINERGHVMFIEFKRTGMKPTIPQLREHDKLRKSNVNVQVVDNVESGKCLIDDFVVFGEMVNEQPNT